MIEINNNNQEREAKDPEIKHQEITALSLHKKAGELAKAKKVSEMYALLAEIEENHPEHIRNLLKSLAEHFAKHKLLKEVYAFLKLSAERYRKHHETIINYLGVGFISGNHLKEAKGFIKHIGKNYRPQTLRQLLGYIAFSFGSDHPAKGYAFLKEVKRVYPQNFDLVVGNMADGFAREAKKDEGKASFEFVEYVKWRFNEHLSIVLNHVAYGFALEGHVDFVNRILADVAKNHAALLAGVIKEAAMGFARLKDKTKAYQFILTIQENYPAQLSSVFAGLAEGFFEGGCKQEVEKLLKQVKYHYPQHFRDFLLELAKIKTRDKKSIAISEDDLLQAISSLEGEEARQELGLELQDFVDEDLLPGIIAKAGRYQTIMAREHLNYAQLAAWLNPSLWTWILQAAKQFTWQDKEYSYFPKDLINLIAVFNLPPMSGREFQAVVNKVQSRFRFFQQALAPAAERKEENKEQPEQKPTLPMAFIS